MPEVSVIVPMYNSEAFLDRCVTSLLQQTFDDYEVILVDDCSTDGTYEAATRLQDQYAGTIRAIKCEMKGGAGGARNRGIELACGDWLMFVDSDDFVSRDYIRLLWQAVTEAGADLGVGSYQYVFPRGRARTHHLDSRLTASADKAHQMALVPSSPCSKIYKRCLFRDVRFLESVSQEDLGVAAPLVFRASRLAIFHQPLYFYYQRLGSTERSKDRHYSDCRIENLEHLAGLIDGYWDVKEYLHVRELLGYRTINLLRRKQSLSDTWTYVEGRFPSWRSSRLLHLLPQDMRRRIDLIDHGYTWVVGLDVRIRGVYATLRRTDSLSSFLSKGILRV